MSVTKNWPGGISTITGGTRTEIKLGRPWQNDIVVDQARCPFEPEKLGDRKVFRRSDRAGGWLVLGNLFTPHLFHRLIIPNHCWPSGKLRTLGGEENIAAALELAVTTLPDSGAETHLLTVHVGRLAGQNIPHLHWHLVDCPARKNIALAPEEQELLGIQGVSVFREGSVKVCAGGHRAGQCFLLPDDNVKSSPQEFIVALSKLIALFNTRFRSTEGLLPDFQVGFKIRSGKFVYGMYVPIINHWGTAEYFALLGVGSIALPWSHEETAGHLLQSVD